MDLFHITLLLLLVKSIDSDDSCGYPAYPSHATISLSTDYILDGTVVSYMCDIGYELLGPSRRTCSGGSWLPSTIPFCGDLTETNRVPLVIPRDEREAIFNNLIQDKSESTPAFDGQVFEEVSVPDITVTEEADAEDRADPLDTNKFSLNVVDVSPHDTQLAHSVLIVHKPKPNNKTKSKVKPSLLIPQTIAHTIVKGTIVTGVRPATSAIPTTTTEIPVPVRDNHKPLFLRPFPGRKKPSTTTSTTTTTTTTSAPSTTQSAATTTSSPLSFKFTPSTISIHSATASTYSQAMNISLATTESEESDDYPIVFNSNHKKGSQGFTRQKLTSTEYALIFTTPDSTTEGDKIGFSEVPTVTASSYTMRPPYVTTLSQMKRPPMKIMTVNSNKIKQPEEIYSEGITVLDPPFISGHPMKLPPNTTIIHKNLIVPMKDGRPKPVFPMTSTTQFPVYPIVAGITKWHTPATTPWTLPLVTTTSPDQMTGSVGTSFTDSDLAFGQSVTHPTIITSGQPLVSSTAQTTHLVTVTPVKSTSHHHNHHQSASASNTFVVTHAAPSPSPPRPSTTTASYVNAIWAPPMPVARPVQNQPVSGSWYSPITNAFSYDPSSSSMLSFMGIMRTIIFAVLVFALPPLTLALALLQVAVG